LEKIKDERIKKLQFRFGSEFYSSRIPYSLKLKKAVNHPSFVNKVK
jgi:hypothetical protein